MYFENRWGSNALCRAPVGWVSIETTQIHAGEYKQHTSFCANIM